MTNNTRTETRTRTTEVPRLILGIQMGTRIVVEQYTVEVPVPKRTSTLRAAIALGTAPWNFVKSNNEVRDALFDIAPKKRYHDVY